MSGKYLTGVARQADLMRQGFMKPLKIAKAPKPLTPMKACDKCRDWHRGSCKSFQKLLADRLLQK